MKNFFSELIITSNTLTIDEIKVLVWMNNELCGANPTTIPFSVKNISIDTSIKEDKVLDILKSFEDKGYIKRWYSDICDNEKGMIGVIWDGIHKEYDYSAEPLFGFIYPRIPDPKDKDKDDLHQYWAMVG